MSSMNLFDFYQTLSENRFVLTFKGEISQEILVSLGESLQEKISEERSYSKFARKVFAIFVELSQNIYRYSAEKGPLQGEKGCGLVLMQEEEKSFWVISGNFVRNDEVHPLKERCDKINSLDRGQLKKYYKERLKMPRSGEGSAAGLGLIEVARKSGNPLQYDFAPAEGGLSFFTLSVKVDKGKS